MPDPKSCKHYNFKARVGVARLEDVDRCMRGATVSLDGLEALIAITPQGAELNPMQRMVHGRSRLDG